eukprot:gb/GECH01012411.1/.p1 GENE.gb/GECH01012411.1/~~gb/GECH01012411.1/.p1  ORF type:complete len:935 (+),score=230.13 gb/GECH01012411.1/:1-2805(+)
MSQQEKQCTHLVLYDKGASQKEIKEQIEKGPSEAKYDALQKLLLLHLNGEEHPNMLITVILYILPTQNHKLKKLALFYLEVVDRTDANGKLLEQMVLVCNALKRDLSHPNEYLRGVVLRFLTRIHEADLLEPLIPEVLKNLDDRHSYVRRNAVLAVYSIYKEHPHLIPHAPELVEEFIKKENDISSKRNAFVMLFECAQDRAVRYLRTAIDGLASSGDIFQLALLDLIRKLAKTHPAEKANYLRVISTLMESKSSSVLYQCALTFVSLSSSPAVIRAATNCYTRLLTQSSDNNVKLIVLDRLNELKEKFPQVMQEATMDTLRAFNSPDQDIRQNVLDLVIDLVNSRNVEDVVGFFRKELSSFQAATNITDEEEVELRQIIKALRKITIKFPSVAHSVVSTMVDFLAFETEAATDVVYFIRESFSYFPTLKEDLLNSLINKFHIFQSPSVYRTVLWILGTYCESEDHISEAFETIKSAFSFDESEEMEEHESGGSAPSTSIIREDGTYASQPVYEKPSTTSISYKNRLNELLSTGHYFVATCVASSLTKLALKLSKVSKDTELINRTNADSMLAMCEMLKLGRSKDVSKKIDLYSQERISVFFKILSGYNDQINNATTEGTKAAFEQFLEYRKKFEEILHGTDIMEEEKNKTIAFQPDSLINFSQLRGRKAVFEGIEFDDEDLMEAEGEKEDFDFSKVVQLTGSDPIYAEATIKFHQFDIVLDFFLANQTGKTFQKLSLELATSGDLQLTERPQQRTLGPFSTLNIKTSVKIASTDELGVIFGSIIYDATGAGNDQGIITLNEITVDVMDYIGPGTCTEMEFRSMWREFEWENKIVVNTNIREIGKFVDHITKISKMKLVTPYDPEDGECDFFSANLYAKSSFNASALANISIEKTENNELEGIIRLRSDSKGICMSMGEKIGQGQKIHEKKKDL